MLKTDDENKHPDMTIVSYIDVPSDIPVEGNRFRLQVPLMVDNVVCFFSRSLYSARAHSTMHVRTCFLLYLLPTRVNTRLIKPSSSSSLSSSLDAILRVFAPQRENSVGPL